MKHWSHFEKVLLACYGLAVGGALVGSRAATGMLIVLLAAVNMHVIICRHWEVKWGRVWALILVIPLLAAWLGLWIPQIGQPFDGMCRLAQRGPMFFGVVPLAMPFLWYTVLSGFLLLVRTYVPWANATGESLAAASGLTIFAFLLGPGILFAEQGRHAVNWPPILRHALIWWAISYVLVRTLAPTHGMKWEREWRPLAILGGLLLVTLSGRIF